MKFIHEKKIKIFCEDNMVLMSKFKNNHFDVAFVDPEYGIGESNKNHKSRNTPVKQKNGAFLRAKDPIYEKKDWDKKPPDETFFLELKRVSKNQIIFGANYFRAIVGETFKPPRRKNYSEFLKNNPKGWIIWDKVNGNNDFNDCELIYTTFDFDSFIVYYMWNGMMQGEEVSISLQRALIQIGDKKLNEKRLHPTQKPIKIYKWIINRLNLFRKSILDTNIGLMGIVIACYDADCDITGCDNDKEYFSKGIQRIKDHINQQSFSFFQ